jgi:hypothetical protein
MTTTMWPATAALRAVSLRRVIRRVRRGRQLDRQDRGENV